MHSVVNHHMILCFTSVLFELLAVKQQGLPRVLFVTSNSHESIPLTDCVHSPRDSMGLEHSKSLKTHLPLQLLQLV